MFELPALPYSYDALEPHLDARTMEIHHTKHHKSYVDKLNKGLESHPDWQGKSLETLLTSLDKMPETLRTVVRNHGGGHYNHSLFWKVLSPERRDAPVGESGQAIEKAFGSFRSFRDAFTQSAVDHFGSGWTWLCLDSNSSLKVLSTHDHICPVSMGLMPLFVVDLWEHAYYLKFQNRRPDFIGEFWNVANWPEVERRFQEAKKHNASAA